MSCPVLPTSPLPCGAARAPVVLGYGDHGAQLPRRVSEAISDIRWTAAGGLEGLRIRDGQWVDLIEHGARVLEPPEMEALECRP